MVVWAALATWVGIKLTMPFAERWRLIDIPQTPRKSHRAPTPVLGVALALGVLSAFWLWPPSAFSIAFAIGALGVLLLGVDDDRNGRPALYKLIAQIVIASAVVALGGVQFDAVSIGAWRLELGFLAAPWTVLWLVTLTNALNLIDGSDGLAVGISTLIAVGIGVYTQSPLAWSLVGAGMVFWLYNKPRARCFLGDGGAYFLGFWLGTLSMQTSTTAWEGDFPLAAMALMFLVPLGDLGFSIIRRLAQRQGVMSADHGHIHHRLQSRWGQWRMLWTLYGLTALALGGWLMSWWR